MHSEIAFFIRFIIVFLSLILCYVLLGGHSMCYELLCSQVRWEFVSTRQICLNQQIFRNRNNLFVKIFFSLTMSLYGVKFVTSYLVREVFFMMSKSLVILFACNE